MAILSVCSACLKRLKETEIQPLYEDASFAYDPPESWTVSVDSLQHGYSDKGCAICYIHLRAHGQLSSSNRRKTNLKITQSWLAREDANKVYHDEDDEEEETHPDLVRLTLSGQEYDIFTYEDDPAAEFVSSRDGKTANNAAEEAVEKVRVKMAECEAGHGMRHPGECVPSTKTELPLRVIEITPKESDGVKLVEPSPQQKDRYAILSYCWGPDKYNPLQTTKASFVQHCKRIPLDADMTKGQTLRDAVWITRRLGLRYLWIDALCIIQDDDADKDRQISKMGDLYEKAYVCLMGVYGEHASSGLLGSNQNKKRKKPFFQLPFPSPPHSIGTIYASARPPQKPLPLFPLNRRAWTLQESLLPLRRVLFFDDHVSWTCGTKSVVDSGDATNMSDDVRLTSSIKQPSGHNWAAESTTYLLWGTHTAWTNVVEWYTTRSIRYPVSDKLRAVSGISAKFGKILRASYLAGLWDGIYLPAGLLWRVIDDGDPSRSKTRPSSSSSSSSYRAPSWSWAALDERRIEYVLPERLQGSLEEATLGFHESIAKTLRLRVVDTDVTLANPNLPFDRITDGYITLDGFLRNIDVGPLRSSWHSSSDLGRTLRFSLGENDFVECWADASGELPSGTNGDTILTLLAITGAADRCFANDPTSSVAIGFVLKGLLLAKKPKEKNTYTRIGFFELWCAEHDRLVCGFGKQRITIL